MHAHTQQSRSQTLRHPFAAELRETAAQHWGLILIVMLLALFMLGVRTTGGLH